LTLLVGQQERHPTSAVNATVTLGGLSQSAKAKGIKEQQQGMRKNVSLFIKLYTALAL